MPVAKKPALIPVIAAFPPIAVVTSCCNAQGGQHCVYPALTTVRKDAVFVHRSDTGTIPTETEAEKARVEKIKQMGPEKIAPVCAYLLSDAAKDVSGQIFGVRMNEIFLFSQNRPLRSVQRSEGWTPQTIAEHGMPALKGSFYKLDRSADIFPWDPI